MIHKNPFFNISNYCFQNSQLFAGNCNVYTNIPNTQCDGWAYTSFEDCKQKCINNALPEFCDSGQSSKNCTFAVWDDNPDFPPGWCQLAEDGVCNKENTQRWGEQVKIWEKTGKTMISRQRFEHISKGSPFLSFFI